jgi:nucleotide-binding universal stress UspA family protein
MSENQLWCGTLTSQARGLAMKILLVPTDPAVPSQSAVACARLVAERMGASIEGVALRPAFAEVVAPDPIVAVSLPPMDWDESKYIREARSIFESGAGETVSSRWRGGAAIDDGGLGSLGRLYDLTVLPRPGGKGGRMTAFEAALFDSGRPVLMVPPVAPQTLGDTVLIHWNRSTETARAVAFALPLLAKAKRVQFLFVEGSAASGPSAREAVGHLAAHGITATEKAVEAKGRNPGEVILSEAKAFGADLLIKGAYTQSRLRQMIFGGATSHILAKAELPVFFAH